MTFSSSCAIAFKFYNFANRTIFKNVLLEAIYRGKVYNSSYLFLVFSKIQLGGKMAEVASLRVVRCACAHSVSARAGCTSRKNLICEDTQSTVILPGLVLLHYCHL